MTLALVLFCHNQSKTALTLFHDIQLLKKLLARHVFEKTFQWVGVGVGVRGRGRGRGRG